MMDALKFLLPFIVFMVLISWTGRLKKRLNQNRMDQVRKIVQRHGWQLYEESAMTLQCRIAGQTRGIRWQVVTDVSEGTSEKPWTRFTCDEIEYPDLVAMIRTRKALDLHKITATAGGERYANMLVKLGGAQPAHLRLVREGVELKPRDPDVADNYSIVVQRGLERLLTPELEAALADWSRLSPHARDSLTLDVGQSNLRLYCQHLIKPQELDSFTAIGVAAVIAILK